MPEESQPRKNAYDTNFPLLFAFKFRVKFDGVKIKKSSFVLEGEKKREKKKTASLICFCKKWLENLIPLFFGLMHPIYELGHEKTCLMSYANNKGAD